MKLSCAHGVDLLVNDAAGRAIGGGCELGTLEQSSFRVAVPLDFALVEGDARLECVHLRKVGTMGRRTKAQR